MWVALGCSVQCACALPRTPSRETTRKRTTLAVTGGPRCFDRRHCRPGRGLMGHCNGSTASVVLGAANAGTARVDGRAVEGADCGEMGVVVIPVEQGTTSA